MNRWLTCACFALLFITGTTAQRLMAVVDAAKAPIFLYPDATRTPLATLDRGTRLEVIEQSDKWTKVEFGEGQLGRRVGWIATEHLLLLKVGAPTAANNIVQAKNADASGSVTTAPAIAAPAPPAPSSPAAAAMVPRTPGGGPAAKGRTVALRIPPAVMKREGTSIWNGRLSYSVVISDNNGRALSVANNLEWQAAGFPTDLLFKVSKIAQKPEYTEVELTAKLWAIKLRFDPSVKDLNAAFDAVTAPSAASYLPEAYGMLARKIFVGPLANLTQPQQQALLRFAHVVANGTAISSTVYKDKPYLVVDLGTDTTIYNDLKFSQATLVAHVMNERLLTLLKAFAAPVKDAPDVYGIKLEVEIPHRSFLEQSGPDFYRLQLYAPSALVRQFADADITNQQFLDGCVVVVNDNRVQVSLTGGD